MPLIFRGVSTKPPHSSNNFIQLALIKVPPLPKTNEEITISAHAVT